MEILSRSATTDLFIGVLSGTSIDSVDVALVRFDAQPQLLCTHTLAFPAELKANLRRLCTPGTSEIDALGSADVAVGRLFATAINALLAKSNFSAADVRAIGSHGQTVRHRPDLPVPFTLQIGDPNVIALETGIPVVADFRRKDVALGGQGAPLVPAFHEAVFRVPTQDRVVVNLGGIANLTILPADAAKPVLGFDTGPGNTLLDAWTRHVLAQPMDRDGAFAARGRPSAALLECLLAEPFFKRRPPKSTGPEYFSLAWLQGHLAKTTACSPADVQATLVSLTAHSIADAVAATPGLTNPAIFICGGGVRNPMLLSALRERVPQSEVQSTDVLGVAAGWVEAMAFAWLACRHVSGKHGNCPSVTGARDRAILGAYFPAV